LGIPFSDKSHDQPSAHTFGSCLIGNSPGCWYPPLLLSEIGQWPIFNRYLPYRFSERAWSKKGRTAGFDHRIFKILIRTTVAVSTTGDRIACGSSDGSVTFWNVHTKEEGEGFGNGQPVVAIFWLSSRKLAVATRVAVYTYDIGDSETLSSFSITGRVWGMVRSPLGGSQFLVGTSQSGEGAGRDSSFLRITISKRGRVSKYCEKGRLFTQPLASPGEELLGPAVAGKMIACITPPKGVRSFDTESRDLVGNPPLLDAVTSVAVSLNRNLVAQTEDSIQIFSFDVLKGCKGSDVRTSRVYPLGGKHILCLQPNRHIAILELGTLAELRPDVDPSPGLPPTNQSLPAHASAGRRSANFGVSAMQAWWSGTPLPEQLEATGKNTRLHGLSPDLTQIVTFRSSPWYTLYVSDAKNGDVLAKLPFPNRGKVLKGEVYDVTLDSEACIYLKIDGPGRHVQVPYFRGPLLGDISEGIPVPLLEPRVTSPYSLDANYEWVVDAESRKICWISPGNLRRGSGGHFWDGLSLVMVGDDGVVRKISFREPDS
jgi:WD40 repeat protein